MWCFQCKSDVPTELDSVTSGLHCKKCDTELIRADSLPPTSSGDRAIRDAREILRKWSSSDLLDQIAAMPDMPEPLFAAETVSSAAGTKEPAAARRTLDPFVGDLPNVSEREANSASTSAAHSDSAHPASQPPVTLLMKSDRSDIPSEQAGTDTSAESRAPGNDSDDTGGAAGETPAIEAADDLEPVADEVSVTPQPASEIEIHAAAPATSPLNLADAQTQQGQTQQGQNSKVEIEQSGTAQARPADTAIAESETVWVPLSIPDPVIGTATLVAATDAGRSEPAVNEALASSADNRRRHIDRRPLFRQHVSRNEPHRPERQRRPAVDDANSATAPTEGNSNVKNHLRVDRPTATPNETADSRPQSQSQSQSQPSDQTEDSSLPQGIQGQPRQATRRRRIDSPQPVASLSETSSGRRRTGGLPRQRYIDDAHQSQGIRGPHFQVAAPKRSNFTSLTGQFLAYMGVLGLTVGTAMVIYGHFGGYSDYTPTGWLVTTVAQMLLFLGVINLVSGGIEQNNDDVSQRINVLGEQLMRMQEVNEQLLRGPKISARRYADPEAEFEESSRQAVLAEDRSR